ncbi:hypothetical protein HMPREF1250_1756 [Megasphaera vaginalis (ex Srinivasan et al. 2021)]|uniref:Uncharacterized protein n=1 Tax=Megasphaera vaginalis (ex Srinivasan et al. 2021) TaxID=1111454 RepID=U7UCR1_9FIRM|nr:hypothetical protein HMPREF1250_1756 [Megasphaera vaginalis (ex Srinivasan et al. 2021)]
MMLATAFLCLSLLNFLLFLPRCIIKYLLHTKGTGILFTSYFLKNFIV